MCCLALSSILLAYYLRPAQNPLEEAVYEKFKGNSKFRAFLFQIFEVFWPVFSSGILFLILGCGFLTKDPKHTVNAFDSFRSSFSLGFLGSKNQASKTKSIIFKFGLAFNHDLEALVNYLVIC